MEEKDRLFLTPSQALGSIRIDFAQYAPQVRLFCNLVPQVFEAGALVRPGTGQDEFWLRTGRTAPLQRVAGRELGERILSHLETSPPSLERLAAICYQVFQTRTVTGTQGGRDGLWVETGMEQFTCRQCGQCCRNLRFRDAGTADDYRRIRGLGREDILAWMAPVLREGRLVACRLWIDPDTGRYAEVCPWLEQTASGQAYCRIHEIRPEICRHYPGTRKHAEMTGCVGFLPPAG